jgi:Cu/Ag efflux protein CusF
MRTKVKLRGVIAFLAALMSGVSIFAVAASAAQQGDAAQQASASKKARAVGTVKSINGNTVTLTTDAGSEINVTIQPSTRLVRTTPGSDLKTAPAIQLSDVQVGDRMLAGGTASDDGKTVAATTAVVMKKSDVAEKQEHDRQEWQKNGIGGVVKSVDAAAGTITLSTGTVGAPSTTLIHVSKDTVIRRYAPDSIKFDDAKPGTLDQVKAGDQLRARGTKSADGKEMDAAEIVSGSFRSIPATVIAADPSNNTVTVTDLTNKRPVMLKIGPDSQMHQLPPAFAQRIAMRLKGGAAGAGGQGAQGQQGGGAATHAQGGEQNPGAGGQGGARAGGAPDFQQMLNRMPSVSLNALSKGAAVMIVATEGTAESPSTVIILLSGVEPILTAASPVQASTILSPWNLSAGANAGTGDTP